MRWLALCLALAACDTGSRGTPPLTQASECVPMPLECPAQTNCTVTTVEKDGQEVRVCGGTACCASFCALNGCGECCATPAVP